jgi:Domain of unknown function (DUF4389)
MEFHPPSEPEPPWPPAEPPGEAPGPPDVTPGPDRHPIRVVVTDDLERRRLTVFFRWLLAIPLVIWLAIWSIGVFFVAIVNWFVTLIRGITPISIHDFFAAYVRFTTHVHAYLFLAANPYPGFTGKPGYPIDVEIDPPAPQNRWKIAFRFFLALPALMLAGALIGAPGGGGSSRSYNDQSAGGADYAISFGSAFITISVLAWFACLVRARMPHGLRDLFAYGLRYGAQAWGYLFLLTDRYPNADPELPAAAAPEKPRAVQIRVEDDLRRSRLTVFFRFLLFLPHLVWVVLWTIVAVLAAIVSWFATLITGQSPAALHRFLAAYVRYTVHISAYVLLIANPFPGFTGAPGTYPLEVAIAGPERQTRWKTAFRAILAIPAFVISGTLNGAVVLVAFFGWFVALALGRFPQSFRNLGAWALRYGAETDAYLYLLTDTYPYSGPWEFAPPVAAPPEPEPEPEPAFA